MTLVEVGSLIKQRRVALGITQQHLSVVSEVAIVTIKMLELGKGNPSFQTLEKLAETLGLELSMHVRTIRR
jgi:transcriptional regulator with XRE-family HTH domain